MTTPNRDKLMAPWLSFGSNGFRCRFTVRRMTLGTLRATESTSVTSLAAPNCSS